MAAPTPPSGGRGVRRTQAPSRLTYEALGNPSDFHNQSYGYQAGANGYQAGAGYQAGVGYQAGAGYQDVAGYQGGGNAQMHLFEEPQDGGHDGGAPQSQVGGANGNGPTGSRVGGANGNGLTGSQAGGANGGGPTGSQVGVAQRGAAAVGGKAKTVVTNASSKSIRLKQNEIDANKKIENLEEQLSIKRRELKREESELNRAIAKLDIIKKNPKNSSREEVMELELKIVDLQANVDISKNELSEMDQIAKRKVTIIQEEKSLNEEVIIEEDNSNTSTVPSEEKKKNVEAWVQQQQLQNQDFDDFSAQPIPTPTATDNAVVTQLVTALGQAFGNGNRQSIVTKQVDKDLPVFTGKPEDWLTFISEYERTSQKYHYDDSENVIRLRKFLKGPAKDCINHLLANPSNVNKITFTLQQRFGNPQFVLSSLVEKAKGVKSPDVNKPETIVEFGTAVDVLVTNVIAFQMNDYLNNVQLLTELTEKLPAVLRRDWYRWIQYANRKENLEAFSIWLSNEVATAIRSVKPVVEDDKRNERGKRQHGFNAAGEKADDNCACCGKGKHSTSVCYSFKKKNCEDRWKIVRENKLCFQCLGKGHLSSSCPNSRLCEMEGCEKYHHRLLHRQKTEMPSLEKKDGTTSHTANMAGQVSRPLMYVKVSGPLGTRKVLALLDSGCSFTAVEEEVAVQLGLEVERSDFTFQVFKGKKETEEKCGNTMMTVEGNRRNAQQFKLQDVKTMKKLGISGNPLNLDDLIKRYPYIRRGKATSIPDSPPQMVIGFDNYRLFHSRRTVEGPKLEDPSAHQCRLGWYICTGDSSTECYYACEACSVESDNDIHRQIKDFFAVETTGVKAVTPSRSKEDMRALKLLENNTKQTDGRWETCLLWKDDDAMLPESKNMALRRLQIMERKMDKNPEFASLVNQKFADYIEKGYLIPANQHKEEVEPSPRKWYLPWFFAYHPTKKPRLVYDAAAKSNGKCLNDFLLKGPDLLNPLPAVLMRFRENKIAITGDIKEMFHQVKLRKEDWPSQTVLFSGGESGGEPTEYYMTVLFFGAASSPCSAIYAKNKNAEMFRVKYPVAVDAINNNFYMDDYLGTTSTEEEAIQLREEITAIHAAGGFQIAKWNSNSTRVLQSIPANLRAEKEVQLSSKTELYLDKTLGMWWCPVTDHFQFKVNMERIPAAVVSKKRRPTKREVTSVVMSLFDPLGFLSPVKVKAMIIIQNIWKSGISWDDELTSQLDEQWNSWLMELEDVKTVKISRELTKLDFDCVDMHIFVDASEVAYSSALYLRFTSGGKVEQALIAGKARVAPIKGMTIPRMELEAALMGSRLATTVKNVFGFTMKIRSTSFWSDSKTVLCWLRSRSGRFKMYVQSRVGEILENSDVNEWRWVPTKQNVADDATRSKISFDFDSNCRWLKGVGFLLQSETDWPKEDLALLTGVKADDLEIKQEAFAAVEVMQSDLPPISRFSSWIRLMRATAAVFLAVRKFKKIPPGYITVDDMRAAQVKWMKKVQTESFPEEMVAVEKGESLKKTSRLRMLSLACNNDGLLVLRGRIDAVGDDNKVAKHPVILDPKHPYTQLWIQWFHEIGGHHGQERVISEIRKVAWVLDCRCAVRKCWATCQVCKLRKLQPQQPEMGQLPVCRLGMARQPFFHTGVDLFGPLQVKVNRSLQKRWGIIFTCMSSRAVYLDIVESLEAAEVINAITRFVSVRGRPHHLWSDNGTNFVKASKEIRAALAEWNQQDFQTTLTTIGIEWHFNPPAAPHMGGSWERLIGLAKRIMMSLLKSQAPRESVLRTVLMQAADIMNSRPLTYASADPDDAECITPNHLVKMSSANGPTIPGIYEEKDRFRRMWKYTQHLADEFWRRWTSEYLPTLLRRAKWTKTVEPLKVGDVVFLVDDLIPRSTWKKGIVVGTFPGKDGQVRVVDVRVALGDVKKKNISFTVLRRPAVKVIPLGLCSIVTGGHWEGGNVIVASSEEEGTGGAEDEREK